MKKFCDENCNECELFNSKSSRQLSLLLNTLEKVYGEGVVQITNEICPNLTCCEDCHIDDFTHFENCEIDEESRKIAKNWLDSNNDE